MNGLKWQVSHPVPHRRAEAVNFKDDYSKKDRVPEKSLTAFSREIPQ